MGPFGKVETIIKWVKFGFTAYTALAGGALWLDAKIQKRRRDKRRQKEEEERVQAGREPEPPKRKR